MAYFPPYACLPNDLLVLTLGVTSRLTALVD